MCMMPGPESNLHLYVLLKWKFEICTTLENLYLVSDPIYSKSC
jgi:hypothetical protein